MKEQTNTVGGFAQSLVFEPSPHNLSENQFDSELQEEVNHLRVRDGMLTVGGADNPDN